MHGTSVRLRGIGFLGNLCRKGKAGHIFGMRGSHSKYVPLPSPDKALRFVGVRKEPEMRAVSSCRSLTARPQVVLIV